MCFSYWYSENSDFLAVLAPLTSLDQWNTFPTMGDGRLGHRASFVDNSMSGNRFDFGTVGSGWLLDYGPSSWSDGLEHLHIFLSRASQIVLGVIPTTIIYPFGSGSVGSMRDLNLDLDSIWFYGGIGFLNQLVLYHRVGYSYQWHKADKSD